MITLVRIRFYYVLTMLIPGVQAFLTSMRQPATALLPDPSLALAVRGQVTSCGFFIFLIVKIRSARLPWSAPIQMISGATSTTARIGLMWITITTPGTTQTTTTTSPIVAVHLVTEGCGAVGSSIDVVTVTIMIITITAATIPYTSAAKTSHPHPIQTITPVIQNRAPGGSQVARVGKGVLRDCNVVGELVHVVHGGGRALGADRGRDEDWTLRVENSTMMSIIVTTRTRTTGGVIQPGTGLRMGRVAVVKVGIASHISCIVDIRDDVCLEGNNEQSIIIISKF